MILEYKGKHPQIDPDAYIAPNAVITGDVVIGPRASVWFGVVIRGDKGPVRIGSGTNIQDNTVVHVNDTNATIIGDTVSIGHGAVVEGCVIEDGALIGMNATVLSGAHVGRGAVVAAGALVLENAIIDAGMLAAGIPARVRGTVGDELRARVDKIPGDYRQLSIDYGAEDA